jgi:hypothetical protein
MTVTTSYPLYVVFGRGWPNAAFRCRFCTGRVKSSPSRGRQEAGGGSGSTSSGKVSTSSSQNQTSEQEAEAPARQRECEEAARRLLEVADPVCLRAQEGGRDHDWLHTVNPVTTYYRAVIEEFWRQECPGQDPTRLASPVFQALKKKLVAQLSLGVDQLASKVGTRILLQFDKPQRGAGPAE